MFVWCPPSINSKGSWRETTLFYIILWMKKPTVYILHLDLLHKILLEYFFFDRKPRDQSSSSTSIPRILIYYLQLLGYLYHRGVVHVRLPTTNVQLLTQFLLLYIHKKCSSKRERSLHNHTDDSSMTLLLRQVLFAHATSYNFYLSRNAFWEYVI